MLGIKYMCLCADCVQDQIPVSPVNIFPNPRSTTANSSAVARYPLASSHSAESSESSSDGARNVALLYLFGSGGGQAFGWHWMNFGNKFKIKPWLAWLAANISINVWKAQHHLILEEDGENEAQTDPNGGQDSFWLQALCPLVTYLMDVAGVPDHLLWRGIFAVGSAGVWLERAEGIAVLAVRHTEMVMRISWFPNRIHSRSWPKCVEILRLNFQHDPAVVIYCFTPLFCDFCGWFMTRSFERTLAASASMLNSCKALPWRWLVCCCALWSPRIAKSSLASRVERVDLKNTTKSSKSSTNFAQRLPQPWYCRFKESREKSSNQSTRTLLPYWRWLGFGGFLGLGVLVNLKEIRLLEHGTIPCSRQFKVDWSEKLMSCLPGTEFIILRIVRDLFSLPEIHAAYSTVKIDIFQRLNHSLLLAVDALAWDVLWLPTENINKKSNTYNIFVVHILYRDKRRFRKHQFKYLCFDLIWQIPFSFSFNARFLRMLALPTVSGLCWARLACGSCTTSLSMAWSRMMLPSSIRASWCQAANPCSHAWTPWTHETEARMEITGTVLWQCFAPRSRFRLTIFFKAGTAWKTRFQRNACNL